MKHIVRGLLATLMFGFYHALANAVGWAFDADVYHVLVNLTLSFVLVFHFERVST